MKRLVRFTAGVVFFGFSLCSAHAFTGLYCWGDGVCTTTNNTSPYPSPTNYFGQRFCNGPVWIEDLAQLQGLSYDFTKNRSAFGNYSSWLVTAVTNPAPSNPSTALCVVWVVDADLWWCCSTFGTSLTQWTNYLHQTQVNHLKAITNLYNKGVRTLIMPNAVDMSKVPEFATTQPGSTLTFINQRCVAFNVDFANTLNTARSTLPGLVIYSPDFFTLQHNFMTYPNNYGLTNAIVAAVGDPPAGDSHLVNKSINGPGAKYIFWDSLDPTAKAQAVMGTIASQLLSPVVPQINKLTLLGGNNRLDVSNIPIGKDGVVLGRTDLKLGLANWSVVANIVNSANASQSILVPASSSPVQFYRLRF